MAFKCPHCLIMFHDTWNRGPLFNSATDRDKIWGLEHTLCPNCSRAILFLMQNMPGQGISRYQMVWPKAPSRAPLPKEVPDPYAKDYREAAAVLNDSANASAALSRRCLQFILREKAGTKSRDLFDQIQEVIDKNNLPSHLNRAIDGVRAIGNFGAHPMKSTNTGEILDAEPGEAEWLLDTLESLFDFYFVQPALLEAKRDALNAKLATVNKPPIR